MELAGAVQKASLSSFVVQRAIQRLERDELTVIGAVAMITAQVIPLKISDAETNVADVI
jgi:hypothetical protein